jgi:hypothetical protein
MCSRRLALPLMLLSVGCWHRDPTGARSALDGSAPDLEDVSDATIGDASESDGLGVGVDTGPPPRPVGCDAIDTLVDENVFSDGFESYAVGPFENAPGSPWVRASMGRDVEISSAASSSGTNSLLIQSFTTKTETDYVPLSADPLPPRISFQATFLLDGFIVYEDFVSWGLAVVRSKYDIQSVLQLKMSNHDLTLVPADGSAPVPLFSELDYGDPPRANTVRVDVDLCAWQVSVSVGVPTSSLALRATTPIQPFSSVSALYLSGGVNQVYVDDAAVDLLAAP